MKNQASVRENGGRPLKTVEQKLYEAMLKQSGVRLSYTEVERLTFDEALQTRICNTAMREQNGEELGSGGSFDNAIGRNYSWRQFRRYLTGELN